MILGRLKDDGNMLISGELNERLPTVTNGLVAHYPFDGTLQSYLPNKIRYIRDFLINGSTANTGNHWVEIQAIDYDGNNVALNKLAYIEDNPSKTCPNLVDGDTNTGQWSLTNMSEGNYRTVDLGDLYPVRLIKVWHYWGDGRTYYKNKTAVSEDGVNWYFVFNGEVEGDYAESSNGHIIDLLNLGYTCKATVSSFGVTLTQDGIYIDEATSNISPREDFNACNGVHIGNPFLSNGNYTVLGGNWRASTHYNDGICRVVYTDTPYGWGKVLRWEHRNVTGWKGITSTHAFQAKAGVTYTASVWTRVSHKGANPTGYAFYGATGYQYSFRWEKSPSENPNEWIRGTVTFTPDIDQNGGAYLYGDTNGQAGVTIEYWGFQIEQKGYATNYVVGSRSTGSVKVSAPTGNKFTVFLEFTPSVSWYSFYTIGYNRRLFNIYDANTGKKIWFDDYHASGVMNYSNPWVGFDEFNSSSSGYPWHWHGVKMRAEAGSKCWVALVKDGTTWTIYQFSPYSSVVQKNSITHLEPNVVNFSIKEIELTGDYCVKIKNLSVYDRALTESEILSLTNSQYGFSPIGDLKVNNLKESPSHIPLSSDVHYFPLSNNLLSSNEILSANEYKVDFEDGKAFFSGRGNISIVTNPTIYGNSLQFSCSYPERVAICSKYATREQRPYIEGWVRTNTGFSTSGFSGLGILTQPLVTGAYSKGYFAFIDARNGKNRTDTAFQLRATMDMSALLAYDDTITVQVDKWYRIRIDITGNLVIARLYDTNGTLLSIISAEDTRYTSGNFAITAIDTSFYDDIYFGHNGNSVFNGEGAWVGSAVTNMFPQAYKDADFSYKGYGEFVCKNLGYTVEYEYDYSQNVTGTYHGHNIPVQSGIKYHVSMDVLITNDANISDTGKTFVANMEGGCSTTFYYDNTRKGEWQHLSTIVTATGTSTKFLLYPTTSVIFASKGFVKYRNVQMTALPFETPFVNDSRPASSLEFNLHNLVGLNWAGDWTIIYWKKPIGTHNNTLTGYNIDSLGCNSNNIGGGYTWWGKTNGDNALAYTTPSSIDPNKYFGTWRMVSLQKTGTTVVIKEWSPKEGIYTATFGTTNTVPNYYVTQYGYDLKLGGFDNGYPQNTYYRDLIVAKRRLSDAEVESIYRSKLSLKDKNLYINGNLSECILL